MSEVTLKDLYKLRSTLKNRMVILNKIKEGGHYKNSVHSQGVENFIERFLDSFCAAHSTNSTYNFTTKTYENNNHVKRGVKGQMEKLVIELKLILKNEGDKVLTYNILCNLVNEYYPKYEKILEVRTKRGKHKSYDNTRRLYPGHVKLRRLMLLEKKQGFTTYGQSCFIPLWTRP